MNKSFWSSIIAGPDGSPGEFQLAFVIFQILIIIGIIYNTILDHHFALESSVGMESAFISAYQAVLAGTSRIMNK